MWGVFASWYYFHNQCSLVLEMVMRCRPLSSYMWGNIKVCLYSVGVGFYITFGVAFVDRHMCQWYNCCGDDIFCITLLFYGEVGIY